MNESFISGIYIIENTVNKKVYIGQSINIPERNRLELSGITINNIFKKDLEYFGVDKFENRVLELIDFRNRDLINERECYWIEKYNSIDSRYGYNISAGHKKKKPRGNNINTFGVKQFRFNYIDFLESSKMGKRISFVVSDEDYQRLKDASFEGKFLKEFLWEAINTWIKRVDRNTYHRLLTQKKYDDPKCRIR